MEADLAVLGENAGRGRLARGMFTERSAFTPGVITKVPLSLFLWDLKSGLLNFAVCPNGQVLYSSSRSQLKPERLP